VAFLKVNADRDQAVRGERVEDPVGELEAARAASAALANPQPGDAVGRGVAQRGGGGDEMLTNGYVPTGLNPQVIIVG
jgi:hypothetical protein